MEIQIIFDSKQSIEWSEVKVHLSQGSQSLPRQSSWAFSKLCTVDNDHQSAIFYRRDSIDNSSDKSVIEDSNNLGNNDGSINAINAINAINTNNTNSKSASSYHNETGKSKPDGSHNDHLQDQNNTITHSINNQTVQSDHSNNGGNDGRRRCNTAATINALVVKYGRFITGKSKDTLGSCIQPWHCPLEKRIVCITTAQWHFDSVVEMQLNDPVRKVIHKLALYHHIQEVNNLIALNGRDPRRDLREIKDEVMRTTQHSASDSKDNLRRKFDLLLQEGKVIYKLYILNPGYMGLIAPILTQYEYGLLIISMSGANYIPSAVIIDRNYDAFEKAWRLMAKEGSAFFQAIIRFSDTIFAVVSPVLAPMPRSEQERISKLCFSDHW